MGNKAYKARHKAKGLCVDCSEPAVPEKNKCKKHRLEDLLRTRVRHSKHKAAGLCSYCNEYALPGKSLCEKHRNQKLINNKVIGRRIRKRYIKEGRCSNCSLKLHPEMDAGYVTCCNCRARS